MNHKEKMRGASVLIAFLVCVSASPDAAETNWSPNSDQIVRLEKKLVLPRGARALRDYGRYYWGTTEKGTRVIHGALVWGQQIGTHIINHQIFQKATDQGCDWIYVWYEPAKDMISVRCDGVG